jgi:anaerobic magnesium-protoporphyrin IX monomethyl ester cyclase
MRSGCLIFIPGINSLAHRERFTTIYDFPRGGLSLASFLEVRGKRVAIVPLDYYVPRSNDPDEIKSRLRSVAQSAVKEFDPALIGIGVPYTMLYPTALRIASFCKEVSSAPVCVGGPHVSYMDRETLKDSGDVDIVVRGEGEWTLLELLEKIERGEDFSDVPGTSVRIAECGVRKKPRPHPDPLPEGEGNSSLITHHPSLVNVNPPRPLGDMKELPLLNYGLLPEGFVRSMAVSIVASRGCAYKCSYCNESKFWGQKVRMTPIDRVVEEVRILSERYNNPPVAFEDSMFNMRTPHFFELCERLKGIRLHPGFYILSRADSVTDEGFRAMRSAGIGNIILGVESASPKVLSAMNKRITMEQAEDACRRGAMAGLKVASFWIIGHPGDSPREAEITLRAIDRLYSSGYMDSSEIALFVPYPGTTIFENPDAYGLEILTYDWERWGRFNTEPVCQLKEFKANDILRYWVEGQRIAGYWRQRRKLGTLSQRERGKGEVGRNDPCPCGSGRKYKKCCGGANDGR